MPKNHGRVVVPLLTPSDDVGAAYAISGRSPGSRKRMLTVYPDDGRMYVGPIGELTEQQKTLKDLIFYNCMRTRDGLLIVTNGAQTDVSDYEGRHVKNFNDDFDPRDPEKSSVAIMEDWGYENDAFFAPWIGTPRIALVRGKDGMMCLSMVTKCGDRAIAKAVRLASLGGGDGSYDSKGHGSAMPTYMGEDKFAVPWYLAVQKIPDTLSPINFNGTTPERIAQEMYDWMDPEYVAATAGAVFVDGKWQLAANNRHETPESFEAEFGK